MEDMEIDQVVDVPDTPDRLTSRHVGRKYCGDPDANKKRERGIPVAREMNNCSNHITVSPSEKSCPSQNAPIFRRAQTEKISGLGTAHSNGAEKMEKGKIKSSKFHSKSSQNGPISVLDLTEENGQSQQLKPTFSHRESRNNLTEGKCNKTLSGPSTSVDRGKSIALSSDCQCPQKSEKQMCLPPFLSTAPRGRGQNRLVRNGCISPHNIATRAKQSAEQNSHQTDGIEQSHAGLSVSSNTTSPISVDDIVAEERGGDRVKGKGVLIHPSSDGLNAGTIHTASSRSVVNNEESGGTSNAARNSIKYSREQGGWRTTRNDVGRFISRQNRNRMDRRDSGISQSSKGINGSLSGEATSLVIPEAEQMTGTHPTGGTLSKRQRKRGSTPGNPNPNGSYNSEIMFLNSSGESSSSSQSPVLSPEVIELLSEPRCTNRLDEDLVDNDNNSSDARARQVEADEILARELQEQLYHDDSFEGRGIDEHLAWELQHVEDPRHTSIDIPHPMLLPRAPSNRQPRTRSRQFPSNRRRAVPQVPLSTSVTQLRNYLRNWSPTAIRSSRGRRPRFPLDMDLDMRLDILEALEDAGGDLGDMGVADDIFRAQRDFNEDDYEMLLALDEGNHQHTGASANQINSLPQSTLQTDNFTEACAVCLETPLKGEIIRHLPCLHKFHKDCIDPWLHRKTSCPVCKSSIT